VSDAVDDSRLDRSFLSASALSYASWPRPRLGLDVKATLPGRGVHLLDDGVVEVHPAEPAVAAGREHLHATIGANRHHGHVEGAAARSKTRMLPVLRLSRPCAMAAAVGSLTMSTTSRPAISPADLGGGRSLSPK